MGILDIPIICVNCLTIFYRYYPKVRYNLAHAHTTYTFCGHKCQNKFFETKKEVQCKNCNKKFIKASKEIAKSVNSNFCSRSCSATFNNKNKEYGTRRSKLELHIEQCLRDRYPNLEILTNNKKEINCELDFFFPMLNIAVEINGIFHYKPIYGEEKYNAIKFMDLFKENECKRKNIRLIVLDVSSQKKFTPQSSEKWVNVIFSEIDAVL